MYRRLILTGNHGLEIIGSETRLDHEISLPASKRERVEANRLIL